MVVEMDDALRCFIFYSMEFFLVDTVMSEAFVFPLQLSLCQVTRPLVCAVSVSYISIFLRDVIISTPLEKNFDNEGSLNNHASLLQPIESTSP